MLCPQCKTQFKCADRGFYNADAYDKSCVVKTECCGAAVRIVPQRSYRLFSVDNVEFDDWGEKITKPKEKTS